MKLSGRQVIRFIEGNIRHHEGPWAGEPFRLLDWQKVVVRDIYDDRDAEGRRRTREVYIETGKGNGKSPFLAALGIVELLCAGPGALVLSLAATYAQAKETTFDVARQLIESSPTIADLCTVKKRKIEGPEGCRWEVMTSDGRKGKAGYRPTCAIMDELQEQPTRHLLDSIQANQVKLSLREPLLIVSGNAGVPDTLAAGWHDRGRRYMDGDKGEDLQGFKAHIYGMSPEADWRDRRLWPLANPALGTIITMDALEKEYRKAEADPGIERRFRQLHLGQWMRTSAAGFLDMEQWEKCTGELPAPAELDTYPLWVGLDGSAVKDMTARARVWVAPDRRIYVEVRHWLPRRTALEYEIKNGVPYSRWEAEGAVHLTDTIEIDHNVKGEIADEIEAFAKVGNLRQVCYDPWKAGELVQRLERSGVVCEPVRQNYEGLSLPTQELAARLKAESITLAPNPCLTWQARNLHVHPDKQGNVRPTKPAAKGKFAGTVHLKIDGVIATILALARAMRYANSLVTAESEAPVVTFI